MKSAGLLLLFFNFCSFLLLNGQNIEKRPLAINDFSTWKAINNQAISNNGKLISFEINPQKGNGVLVVKPIDSGKSDTLKRGFDARFSPESDFIVYKIKQPEDSIRLAKKKKVKKELMPKDSLGILVFSGNKVYRFPNLKQFSVPKENGRWVAFLNDQKKPEKKVPENGNKKVTDTKTKVKSDASNEQLTQLVLFQASSGDTICFQNVTEYFYAPSGRKITFISQTKDSIDHTVVRVFNTENRMCDVIFKQNGIAKKIVTDKPGERVGFLFSTDTIKEKVFSLYYALLAKEQPKAVVYPEKQGLTKDWSPSEFGDLSFSENSKFLFLGTSRKPRAEPKDTLMDDEKPVLDIWSWKDKELQPEQKLNLEKEKKRTYKGIFITENESFIQLGDTIVGEVRNIQKGDGKVALGINQSPYKLQSSWTGDSNADYYLVNIETGNKRMILKNKSMASLSPGGNYVIWYDPSDSTWLARSTKADTNETLNLSSKIPVSLCDERWDMPGEPNPYGIAGWSENDKYLFIYDRYDIWKIDLGGANIPVNVTNNYGRKNDTKFRYIRLDPEAEFIDIRKPVILMAFNERTKLSGYFIADLQKNADPRSLVMKSEKIDNLVKAKNAPVLICTRESVSEFPNIWTGNMSFEHLHQLSDANPQQNLFVWPKVKLVKWISFSGKPLEGLLYLPETIDTTRKYPMIVYFYERNADYLNAYTPPTLTRSTVNRTHYASNGYIVFIPDITYESGNPGKGAFDAIVSGTQFVTNNFQYVDRDNVGIQGQSWGGYQTAWLITQTTMYKAAMAGAPVSNMTSAYGGIRWGSGMSRMFQYEKDQSRIGGTLWDKPLLFIENSPIFYVPKIETPLLIMSNDNDGAVPWYQGIELFTAMRRLNKPAWMLTYNNEEHNLKAENRANRIDLTIRMKQFFDHYLKGETMPSWMKDGIPSIRKGKELGY
jgi:dipeptidyl aminopeptidase/acylaminoacyl peptidase